MRNAPEMRFGFVLDERGHVVSTVVTGVRHADGNRILAKLDREIRGFARAAKQRLKELNLEKLGHGAPE